MVDVFISYKHEERARCERIALKLRSLDLDVWFDADLAPGRTFDEEIEAVVSAARSVLVLWSPASVSSRWVRSEATIGLDRSVLVAAQLSPCKPPPPFNLIHYEALHEPDFPDDHSGWLKILERIGDLTERPGLAGYSRTMGQAVGRLLAWAEHNDADPLAGRMRRMAARLAAVDEEAASSRLPARSGGERPPGRETSIPDVRTSAGAGWVDTLAREPVGGNLVPGSKWDHAVQGLERSARPRMVTLPPGRFLMGAPASEASSRGSERPTHEVLIDYLFAMGEHPVTFEQWDAAMASGAPLAKPDDQGWGRERRPVINVSWHDAKAYLAWLNDRSGLSGRPDAYRLPSEAEWEYACRAGTTTPFSFGATISTDQANFDGNYAYGAGKKSGVYRQQTSPVDEFPANAFGLHDTHGNVWEWCEDTWRDTYTGAPDDGAAWTNGDASRRVLRGGSWYGTPDSCRSAYRNWGDATCRAYYIGFRLARTLLPPAS